MARRMIAVVGAGECHGDTLTLAYEVGKLIAERGVVLVTGGSTGVMEAASHGAHEAGGLVIGILSEGVAEAANQWVDVAIPTGMGQLRNGLVVASASVVIAVGGEWGTLSEIALARKIDRPVVGLHTWRFARGEGANDDILRVDSAREAVDQAFVLLAG